MSYYHCYREHKFNNSSLATIEQANAIIEEMSAQGYILTLRQLYYQFVRRNWVANTERSYKRLGNIMTNAREAGLVSWTAIEDRGRTCAMIHPEEDPANVVNGLEYGITYDLWARQDTYVEVWVEKQALESVISRPCSRLRVPYMACKGFLSASEAWRAGLRFAEARQERGKDCVLIHLADHDPSGMDMTRDNEERLGIFAEDFTGNIEVRRIALNMDQVTRYSPPPNPAKQSDSRYVKYCRRYGPDSWELDALEPGTIEKLISDTVEEYIDRDIWNATREEEQETMKILAAVSDHWDEVEEFLRDKMEDE